MTSRRSTRWTMRFWDRSGKPRLSSTSSFLAEATAIAAAAAAQLSVAESDPAGIAPMEAGAEVGAEGTAAMPASLVFVPVLILAK